MNRQEPYIGMPIILGSFDDEPAACCGQMEIQPRPAGNNASESMEDRREQMQQQRMDRERDQQNDRQMERRMEQQSGSQMNQSRQPMVLAMAYVPWQRWNEVYPLDEVLDKGTIFPELYLPFEGRGMGGNRR